MGIPIVDELGQELERTWRGLDHDLTSFPQLAAERLASARLPERLDPGDVVRAVFERDLPRQCDPSARFGQPPVTLFRHERFYVDALFWVDGSPSIHDHAFSGAFQVLAGRSIETNFAFELARDVDGHMRLGQLGVRGSALRSKGDVRAVPAGPTYIHSLFHLDRPSLTLVVRTYGDPSPGVQFRYSLAGLAHDPFLEDDGRARAAQMVDMLRRTQHPDLEKLMGDFISRTDAGTAFAVLRACVKLPDQAQVERLIDRVSDAALAGGLRRWVAEWRWTNFLISRRELVHQADLRYLLAVLLNARRRQDALALVRAYAPGVDPARRVAAWLGELSNTKLRLQVGGGPFEPNVLGLPTFEPGCEDALVAELSGAPPVKGDRELAFLARLRALPPLRPLFETR